MGGDRDKTAGDFNKNCIVYAPYCFVCYSKEVTDGMQIKNSDIYVIAHLKKEDNEASVAGS